MADSFLTDTDRITVLEQQLKLLTGRVEALETREAQRELKDAGLTPEDGTYLQAQLEEAAAGSKQADTLNHLQ